MKKTAKRKSAPKSKARAKKPAARKPPAATYEPKPLQTIGWAPFRYPLR
jgi:hypothetical protein